MPQSKQSKINGPFRGINCVLMLYIQDEVGLEEEKVYLFI